MGSNSQDDEDKAKLLDANNWAKLAECIGWSALKLLCFALFMVNFLYYRRLSPDVINTLFPTTDGISAGSGVPQQNAQCSSTILLENLENNKIINMLKFPDPTQAGGGGLGDVAFPSPALFDGLWSTPYREVSNKVSQFTQTVLELGFFRDTDSIINNFFFQGLYLYVIAFLCSAFGSWIMIIYSYICIVSQAFENNIFVGILMLFLGMFWCLIPAGAVTIKWVFLFINPLICVAMDKQHNLKNVLKIIRCNIPVLVALFGFYVASDCGGVFGSSVSIGMMIWLAYSTWKAIKK